MGRFLLLEDERPDRELLREALEHYRPVDMVERVSDACTLLRRGGPFIGFVFDIHLPDGDGLSLLERLRSRLGAEVPALVVTSLPITRAMVLQVGVLGRLLGKPRPPLAPSRFVSGVQRFAGEALDYERRTLGLRATIFDLASGELTPTQMEVAVLGALGYTRTEIASELGVRESTARAHISEVLDKCGLKGKGLRALAKAVLARSRES